MRGAAAKKAAPADAAAGTEAKKRTMAGVEPDGSHRFNQASWHGAIRAPTISPASAGGRLFMATRARRETAHANTTNVAMHPKGSPSSASANAPAAKATRGQRILWRFRRLVSPDGAVGLVRNASHSATSRSKGGLAPPKAGAISWTAAAVTSANVKNTICTSSVFTAYEHIFEGREVDRRSDIPLPLEP